MDPMDQPRFVIQPEESESTAKRHGVSIPNLLPLLVTPAKALARPPISNFPEAAIGVGSSNRIFVGVNIEFSNLPLHHTIHAEQFLVTNLLLNSEPNLLHISVSAAPCGHCRQFLQELRNAPEIKIEEKGAFVRLNNILPHRFGPHDLLHKDIPLLLEPHHNNLTLLDRNGVREYSDLKLTALSAANRSYSPYSLCPSGVAMTDCQGKVYRGWYLESAAYNPSLGPVQAALVDYVANGGGGGFERIVGAVLVEKKDAVVRQEHTARMLLQVIAPKCDFKVFHCS